MDQRTRFWWTCGVLLVAGLLYASTLGHGFVYEDENWIDTITVAPSLYRVPGRAVSYLTQYATYLVGGFDPAWYHAGNVALHLVNGLLVAAIASVLIGPVGGVFAASVFLLHPLSSAAVAYATGRADLLMTCGVLLAVWASLRAGWRVVVVPVGLLLAAMSKEMGLIGIALVALTRPSIWWLSGAGVAATVLVPMAPIWFEMPASVGGPSLPWGEWLLLQNGALWHLLTLTIWPVGFSIDHDALALSPRALLMSVLLTVQAVALVALCWRRVPIVAYGVAWVAVSVAPRFVFRTSEFVTEPQIYLPMVGISVLAGAALAWLWQPALSERTA